MNTEYWSCNEDCENWLANDPLEAAQEEQADVGDVITIYKGANNAPPMPSNFLSYNHIANGILDGSIDKYSDEALENWKYDIDAFTDHMNTCINKWFQDNNCMPTFFNFSEIKPFEFIVTKVGSYGYIEEIEKVES